jgi:hypothetical protein
MLREFRRSLQNNAVRKDHAAYTRRKDKSKEFRERSCVHKAEPQRRRDYEDGACMHEARIQRQDQKKNSKDRVMEGERTCGFEHYTHGVKLTNKDCHHHRPCGIHRIVNNK